MKGLGTKHILITVEGDKLSNGSVRLGLDLSPVAGRSTADLRIIVVPDDLTLQLDHATNSVGK
jgi:hypothetical protein